MENYSQMRKLEHIIVTCMVVFVVVLVLAIYSFVSLGKARRANAKYDEFITALEQQESELKSSVGEMNTDEYLEEQARDYLGMIKDGETLYVFK